VPTDLPPPWRPSAATVEVVGIERAPTAAGRTTLPMDRQNLARELQRALRRARCYEGPINGTWTPATRRAMTAFIERVNATLPVEQPDIVLLALLQSERGVACRSCSEGQQVGADGSCLPAGLVQQTAQQTSKSPRLARETRLAVRARQRDPAVAIVAGASTMNGYHASPIEGRMSIGAPMIAAPSGERIDAGTQASASPGSGHPQAAMPAEGHAVRHRGRRLARAYRPLRPMRFAYRPMRRLRGLAVLFGGSRF
jgi:peptidoglycan hydrolase-like protein with peptidoglycan-binding domain